MMIQKRESLYVPALLAAIATLGVLISVEAQFMAHRIEFGSQERPSNKFLKHIMELDLPINTRRVPAQNRVINRRVDEQGANSIDSKVVDSGENECNPNSINFNYDGFDCVCSRLASGKVFCTKQQQDQKQHQQQHPDRISPNDPENFMLLNNFEKLVAELVSQKARLSKDYKPQ